MNFFNQNANCPFLITKLSLIGQKHAFRLKKLSQRLFNAS